MKKLILLPYLTLFLFMTIHYGVASDYHKESTKGWKAGVARGKITPRDPMWMSGYSRNHPSEGTLIDLWAKALVFEDAGGEKAVLVTMDLLFLTREMSDNIKSRLNKKYKLDPAQIILSWSHTHTGPLVRYELFYDDPYNFNPNEVEKIEKYSSWLENQIVDLADQALSSMVPVKVFSGIGVARFAVNRRNNKEAELTPLTPLIGPVDHSVPVIKVTKSSGEAMAVVFGYACHSTTLGIYKFSGDYPGFAQIEIEKTFPGTTAMFFAGTGADQNPLPRRTVGMARQHGKTLAAAVEAVISEPMRELTPDIITEYKEIDLPFTTPPTREELKKMVTESSGPQKKWASLLLANLDRDKTLPTSYPHYPIQIWRLGEQNMVVLGGEVVIDYSIRLKQIMGQDLFVMSYANDEVFYIPSTRVLREGGYEGVTVLIYTDRPGTWKANIESLIIQGVLELADKAKIMLPESKLPAK